MENSQQNTAGSQPASQPADEYSTPLPQGATVSQPLGQDEYSTPLPQGATIGNGPIQNPTALQRANSALTGENDLGWESPSLGGMLSGALKSAAGGLGNIVDMLNNPQGVAAQFIDKAASVPTLGATHAIEQMREQTRMQRFAQSFKDANPNATNEQVVAYLNRKKNEPSSQHVQDAADWLRSGGQPDGFWQHVGAIGEQALELLGTDGISKLTSAPIAAATEAGKAADVIDTVGHAAQTGKVATTLKSNPILSGLVMIGLKASKDATLVGGQNLVHTEDPEQAMKAAALGGTVAAPIHALGEVAGGVANAAEELSPKKVNVAGQDIPVGATHPEAQEPITLAGHAIKAAGTKEGAQNFVAEQTQPAAVAATQKNFTQSATADVDKLHTIQDVQTAHPQLQTVDQISKYMKGEAKNTYQKLDAAAQPDVDAWEAKYGKEAQAEKGAPVTLFGPNGEPVVTTQAGDVIPDKPKLFTELQDQIRDAKGTIGNGASSQVDKEKAIQNLPVYEKEMTDFLTKHADAVNPGELDAANSTYSKGIKYEWVADKIRQATRGAGEGSTFKGDLNSLAPKSLESLPRQYDTKFGEGSFLNLLGSKGMRNYNDVVNTLKTPKTGDMFFNWLQQLPFNVGKIATIPAGAQADKILFDPVRGQQVMNAFRKFEAASHAAAKVPGAAASSSGALQGALGATKNQLGGSNPQ